jgi:hypothetical protein
MKQKTQAYLEGTARLFSEMQDEIYRLQPIEECLNMLLNHIQIKYPT